MHEVLSEFYLKKKTKLRSLFPETKKCIEKGIKSDARPFCYNK